MSPKTKSTYEARQENPIPFAGEKINTKQDKRGEKHYFPRNSTREEEPGHK
jgi:hypothetical protein